MEEHPYSNYLEGRDPVAIMAETPARLHDLLNGLSADQIDASPGPNKWSLREIMAHFADCEIAWSWRIRQTLATDNPALQPFEQDAWAERYAAYDFALAQTTFQALRAWNLRLLSTVTAEDRQRPATHAERGAFPLASILGTVAGHDLHHLHLLESLLRKQERQAVPSPS